MSAKKTLIFIPTFNERDNVRPMCEQILALGLDADLVFMDDNSPDGTGQVIDELAEQCQRVRAIHREGKLGIGSAHIEGIAFAYAEGYEKLVTLDCDFTHSPALIPTFIARSESADVVVGSRYLDKASLPGWSLLRKSLTTVGHTLTKNLLGMAEDATGAFRVYNLDAISQDVFGLVQSRGYAFFFESLLVIQRNGFRIAEVPIVLPTRTYGHSKMNLREVQRSVSTLMSLYLQDKANPSRFQLSKSAPELNRELVDPQNWNEYWDKKSVKAAAAYELIASAYRNLVIKRRLDETINREFAPGSQLLHAGCGSGQVDRDLHRNHRITAVDISESALNIYRRENPSVERICHASIFSLPFEDASFDGAYNLGVVEHFTHDELRQIFAELGRVLTPQGKLVLFWPHARATSVKALGAAHWLLNDVMGKNVKFHPPEVSLVHSSSEAAEVLAASGFSLESYAFGVKDFFVQAVVVATKQ